MRNVLVGGTAMDDDYNKEMTKKMSAAEKKVYGDWDTMQRAEMDMRTLMDAGEIRRDSKRYDMARECAKHKAKEMNSIVRES